MTADDYARTDMVRLINAELRAGLEEAQAEDDPS